MYAPTNLARYGAVQVNTASPGRVLVMLYDAALRFLREAGEAMDAKDKDRGPKKLNAASKIIEQLLTTLDRTQAAELGNTLEALYSFCLRHLSTAALTMDGDKAREVAAVLQPVRDAFATAVQKTEDQTRPTLPMRRAG